MIFEHSPITLPKLERINRDGVRYYKHPHSDKEQTFVSITSVTSFLIVRFLRSGERE